MKLYFKTKVDRNGNTYHLCIDTENRCFSTIGYRPIGKNAVVIGKRDLFNMRDELIQAGWQDNWY